jgi:hypothetical protein
LEQARKKQDGRWSVDGRWASEWEHGASQDTASLDSLSGLPLFYNYDYSKTRLRVSPQKTFWQIINHQQHVKSC